MRYFTLHRMEDETGVSGTGVVAWGVRWPDGSCSLRWLGKTPSFVNYEGVPTDAQIQRMGDEHVKVVHGHHGKTVLIWAENGSIKPPKKDDVECAHKAQELPTIDEVINTVEQAVTVKSSLDPTGPWWKFWRRTR
jgi:hypothetical protein